jgi:hypothetical protein
MVLNMFGWRWLVCEGTVLRKQGRFWKAGGWNRGCIYLLVYGGFGLVRAQGVMGRWCALLMGAQQFLFGQTL